MNKNLINLDRLKDNDYYTAKKNFNIKINNGSLECIFKNTIFYRSKKGTLVIIKEVL